MTPHDDLNRRDFVKKSAFAASVAAILAKGISLGDTPTATATPTGTGSGTRTTCINDGQTILNSIATGTALELSGFNYNQAASDSLYEMFAHLPPQSFVNDGDPLTNKPDPTSLLQDFGRRMGKKVLKDLENNLPWSTYEDEALGRYSSDVKSFLQDDSAKILGVAALLGYQIFTNPDDSPIKLPDVILDTLQFQKPISGSIDGHAWSGMFTYGILEAEFKLNPDYNTVTQGWPRIGSFGAKITFGVGFSCSF